jgi:hypothetical protein
VGGDPLENRVDEITLTVRQGDQVWSRDTAYSQDGSAQSDGFVMPQGAARVELAVRSVPADEVGTPVRMMAFNIWHAGLLSTLASDEVREQNLQQLIEYVSDEPRASTPLGELDQPREQTLGILPKDATRRRLA